jgi:hypothetical protein
MDHSVNAGIMYRLLLQYCVTEYKGKRARSTLLTLLVVMFLWFTVACLTYAYDLILKTTLAAC